MGQISSLKKRIFRLLSASTQFFSPSMWVPFLGKRKMWRSSLIFARLDFSPFSGTFDKECPQCIWPWEVEVLNNAKKFWNRLKLSWEEGSRVALCLFGTQKSHEAIKQKYESHALSRRMSISKPKGKKKEQKIIIPYMSSMQAFFLLI